MEEREIKLKPVEKDSLYLKISDSIYNYIRMNNLQPGDKLPSERDMAAMLKTSRNSVREALRILEDRGSIYVKTGSGVFINTPVHSVPRFPSLFFIGSRCVEKCLHFPAHRCFGLSISRQPRYHS